jgi:hypothetical protein
VKRRSKRDERGREKKSERERERERERVFTFSNNERKQTRFLLCIEKSNADIVEKKKNFI